MIELLGLAGALLYALGVFALNPRGSWERKARTAETPDEDPRRKQITGHVPHDMRPESCPRCGQPSDSLCDDCRSEAEVSY